MKTKPAIQAAWTDGMDDIAYWWAIVVPPTPADPKLPRPVYIVAGDSVDTALTEAKARGGLFDWDGLTQVHATTRPLSEEHVRASLHKRGYTVQIVIRIDTLSRMDRRLRQLSKATAPAPVSVPVTPVAICLGA